MYREAQDSRELFSHYDVLYTSNVVRLTAVLLDFPTFSDRFLTIFLSNN